MYISTVGPLRAMPLNYVINHTDSQYPIPMRGAPLGEIYRAISQRRLHFTPNGVNRRWKGLGFVFPMHREVS